jgi:hypothetical protein
MGMRSGDVTGGFPDRTPYDIQCRATGLRQSLWKSSTIAATGATA